DIFSLVKIILLFTFATELIGAFILGAYWHRFYPLSKAIFYGIFHAISAFCNAGFSLFTTNLEEFSANYTVVLTIASLFILGGLGFLVIYEIFLCLYAKKTLLSLHAKLTLITNLYLILGGTVLFFFFENSNVLNGFSLTYKIINSFFQAVTPRTAGFNTLPIAHLTDATLFLLIILMFIGASPGSCGGGIKTTTFALFLSFIKNKLQGREKVHILFRTLPNETVQRAITVVSVSGILVVVCTILLLLTQRYGIPHGAGNGGFLEYLFEVASAFGTVGLSTGKTPTLNSWGKITLSLLMFIGRVGPLTVVHLVKIEKVTPPYQYSEENVMVG
ncbi:MAG: ATPase, partial [Candidatus Desulfofervidus auxilii]|nr:ATPase [Candidatus Desulfofervidus auxilii]